MAGETVGGEGRAGVSECQQGEMVDLGSKIFYGSVPIRELREARTYCVDLDGTLCTQECPQTYHLARPKPTMIEAIRRLKAQGHTIIIHTARAPSKLGDPTATTVDQLRAWGVPYDRLYLGKPAADVYVDDRAVSPAAFLRLLNPAGPPDQSGGGDVP